MKDYICMKCNLVFRADSSYAKCCGKLEEFSPEKHGELLVGLSNSWINIWKKWKNNELFEKISQELNNDGCYGASTHLNAFIEELVHRTENL